MRMKKFLTVLACFQELNHGGVLFFKPLLQQSFTCNKSQNKGFISTLWKYLIQTHTLKFNILLPQVD